MYNLRYTNTFQEDLDRLDRAVARRILSKLEYLARNPGISQQVQYLAKALEGLKKYRVGDWRVLFWKDDRKKEITLYGVGHRKEVYKLLQRREKKFAS